MPKVIRKIGVNPVLEKPKRVAAYARVSTEKDAMLHSLLAQVDYYSDLIRSHPGWMYCGVYSDEGITGTKANRPGFQELLNECRNGALDMVLTKSISRFARNTVTLLETVRELKSLGVDVFFEEQNIHTISAEGELMMTILASYAQEESLSASENQKWRIRKCFENGEIVNLRFLFGYSVSKDGIRTDPERAETVREVFSRAIDGESLSSIAADLNRRAVSRCLGGRWTALRVRQLLSNEKYTGNAMLQKRFRNNHIEKRERDNRGELPKYYAEGTHEAIIDPDTFEMAQAVLREIYAKTEGRPKAERTAFSCLIRCGNCGKTYKRCRNHGIFFWNCSSYIREGKAKCPGCRIREDMLYKITSSVAPIEDIEQITAKDYTLTYRLRNGTEIVREWQQRSRAESWTDEMKAQASEKTQQQWGERKWQEQ